MSYWLVRFVFLRLLGIVYFVAFLILLKQGIPLLGENGILPAKDFVIAVRAQHNSVFDAFINVPSLFMFKISDNFFLFLAWLGVLISFLVFIGFANSIMLFVLWFLYLSFVHVGQLWYGYGWDIQLLETGFLAIFLVPLLDARPFPRTAAPTLIIWLLRWLAFRINIGSGLIKYRGDSCWKDLTCLDYHFETQPVPNPLSRWFHFQPAWMHRFGVVMTHAVQLISPWLVFPRLLRNIAGFSLLLFQIILIISGNLSFLNWLTLVAVISYFDDSFLRKILPKKIVERAE
ncbi:lipase maturation factor family protein, partial [Candidatus Woesearchaeota archaeon]|nr:lipase maturation factor family protein [Candidatus Woesearchaeota archaeon]